MNFNSITISDIARELGLSVSTVSKALRDSYEISAATKERVLACAAKYNFKPNSIAQSLKLGFSRSIGIVVSTIDNHFFSQVINGIEAVAHANGYTVIITQTHESFDREMQNIEHLVQRSIDGLLISLSTETQDITRLKILQKQGLPIVFFDRVNEDAETCKVTADNFQGAYDATLHLLNHGFKNIAHITSPINTSIAKERLAGYKKAMTDKNVGIKDSNVKYCAHGGRSLEEIEIVLDELMAQPDAPDAIFTASERITTATLGLLNKRKIKIPTQMGLIGFCNTALAEMLSPPLSTVYQPAYQMGQTATELLLMQMKSKNAVIETRTLPTQLFVRESSLKL